MVVAREEHTADAYAMLAEGMPHQAAARDLAARPLSGRGTAYAIALPVTRVPVVVRHNRHGGLLASLRSDLFLPPTRAPHELRVALQLADAGVRTPSILMYAIERVGPLLRRADVVTREVTESRDLAAYMSPDGDERSRAEAWAATRELLRSLRDAGARHHDLNVKNVLLARDTVGGPLHAWVLDVDRVELGRPGDRSAHAANVARLLRSARKWRDERGAEFDEEELDDREGTPPQPPVGAHGVV
ncbi:MAG TPA: lipopolysaccharide kinase InaA family protein [Gemmatimonadaceae bacterium]